jgi:hypothetical protein
LRWLFISGWGYAPHVSSILVVSGENLSTLRKPTSVSRFELQNTRYPCRGVPIGVVHACIHAFPLTVNIFKRINIRRRATPMSPCQGTPAYHLPPSPWFTRGSTWRKSSAVGGISCYAVGSSDGTGGDTRPGHAWHMLAHIIAFLPSIVSA